MSLNGKPVLWLYKEQGDEKRGKEHYGYFKKTIAAVIQAPVISEIVAEAPPAHEAPLESPEAPAEAEPEPNETTEVDTSDKDPCGILYHPCSGVAITEENPLNIIQKKLIELQRKQAVSHFKETPVELLNKKRSDLLLWFLNQSFTDPLSEINEDSLLNYQISGNPFSMSLFESYWDILIALGQLPGFEITKQRYMFDGKVESDLDAIPVSIPEGDKYYYSDIFKYLSKRDIQTSKIGGASDITVAVVTNITNPASINQK